MGNRTSYNQVPIGDLNSPSLSAQTVTRKVKTIDEVDIPKSAENG